jgi:Nickel responsive protein SCO4226-like
MPRFVIQRTFPQGLNVIPNENGAKAMQAITTRNAEQGVTWVQSFVTRDRSRCYCVYDAPDAAAIRQAAEANGLPVDNITEVRVLDPYFYY